MKKNKKKKLYMLIAIAFIVISLGYAILFANLSINGTSRISNFDWDIHFENAQETENSTVTPTVAPSAPAASRLTSIGYDVTFDTPGQIYEFTVDVVNGGVIDAIIESFDSTVKVGDEEEQPVGINNANVPSYLTYSVKFSNDAPIVANHTLNHGQSETIKIRIGFKYDISNEELALASGKVIRFNISVNYKQVDANQEPSGGEQTIDTVYSVSNTPTSLESAIPNEINKRTGDNGPTLAMADWAALTGVENDTKPLFIKHTLDSNENITRNYIGIYLDETLSQEFSATSTSEGTTANAGIHYLVGGFQNEYNVNDYQGKISLLKDLTGWVDNAENNKCRYNGADDDQSFICEFHTSTYGYVWISTSMLGYTTYSIGGAECTVNSYGGSSCRYNSN